MNEAKLHIAGEWVTGESTFPVEDKFTGETLGRVHRASREQVTAAATSAREAVATTSLTPHQRYEILSRAALSVDSEREALMDTIVGETGFTTTDARGEVDRAIQTLTLSAEEAKRITGEMVPLHGTPGQENRLGFTIRVPVGVVGAITPFNSPLNTVVHKVGPALAAGNAVILKPAEATPLTAGRLTEIFLESGLPPGLFGLVNGNGEVGSWLVEESAVSFFTFTGSTRVGKQIQRAVGLRRTQLELGNISSTIVVEDANLDAAIPKCVNASFRKAGQVCTSVQRLYVQASIHDSFVTRLLDATKKTKVGDPRDPETVVGPMISETEAERAEAWVGEAVDRGARVLIGGRREGALFYPTVLTDVRPEMRLMCEEIFAPVISLVRFERLEEAIRQVNDTPYGLAAGVFTESLSTAMKMARELHQGTVHINETSSSRVDAMPYGGSKESGFGREGPRYAVREMTEERLVTIRLS